MNKTHGLSQTPIYRVWQAMMTRCYRFNHPTYQDYGAKGISVYPPWHDFLTFFSAVGHPPSGYTIDRINAYGNYEPGNWQWTTRKEQARNRTNSKLTLARVTRIRSMHASRHKQCDIADTFNVSRQTINDIIKGRIWT